jgi:predicted MPP superfamily phosphohydrolase
MAHRQPRVSGAGFFVTLTPKTPPGEMRMHRLTAFLLRLLGLVALGAVAAYLGNNWLSVSQYEIRVRRLPPALDGLRIVQLSDLHGKRFGRGNRSLAAAVRRAQPDLIICSGDMIGPAGDDGALRELLTALNGQYPVYYSLGNHEQILRSSATHRADYEQMLTTLKELGVGVLDNERARFTKGDASLAIAGFTSRLYHYSGVGSADDESVALSEDFITESLGAAPTEAPLLLIAHNPRWFSEYAGWGADVILAGHVHGGVVRIPGRGGLLSPEGTFFPKYDAGLYHAESATMAVSRGLGSSVIPWRILNRPEVVVITLRPE